MKNALQSFSAFTDIVLSQNVVVVYRCRFQCCSRNYYKRGYYYNSDNNHTR